MQSHAQILTEWADKPIQTQAMRSAIEVLTELAVYRKALESITITERTNPDAELVRSFVSIAGKALWDIDGKK